MRILAVTFILLLAVTGLSAQIIYHIINPSAVEKIERTLSADDMEGRQTFKPGIEKAAAYIEREFHTAGLQPRKGSAGYRQPFSMLSTKLISASVTLDGQPLTTREISILSAAPRVKIDENSGYEKAVIKAGSNLFVEAMHYIHEKKNYLVLVDTSFTKNFQRLTGFSRQQFKSDYNVIFLLTNANPTHYSITAEQEVTESKLANVVGILPGRSKRNEYVIFSGHYDHLGITKPNEKGDSVYNGANDDASGTTAVIMLANYFARARMNERTLVFAAFTAEEIGEYGSQYFSSQFDPATVMAMFNIEMVGTASKWGPNSAFITGYEKSDMAKILEKNLAGSGFSFHPDPYTDQQLFYRSDNASLAKQGVPAHTISTFEIDVDKHYHTLDDDIDHLDMKNMAAIIRAIAISSKTIVEGKDTPTRVDTTQLR